MTSDEESPVPSGQNPEIVVPNVEKEQVKVQKALGPPRDTVAMILASAIVGTFCFGVFSCLAFTFLLHFRPITVTKYGPNGTKVETVQDYAPSSELFKTISAIMSDPLGFVFGFYFRESQKS
jgi:hypothetical protein